MKSLRTLLVIALVSVSAPALAQTHAAEAKAGVVFKVSDALILGAASAGAAGLWHYDREITNWFRQPVLQNNTALRSMMTGARLFGDPGTIVLGVGLWAGGAIRGDQATSTDGVRSLESVAVASALAWLIKGASGRARPYVDSTNSSDWKAGRGFGDRSDFESFPSGHVTAAFAFASAITARVAKRSPAEARWLGPLLYGAATLTGFSRVYDHKHWASDVLLGAAIGTVSGLVVVRSHER